MKKQKKTIYALGFFDGVHLGHQALLRACRHLAQAQGCLAGVLTFSSHPEALISGDAPAFLSATQDRQRLLERYGIDTVVFLPFDEKLMATSWETFLEDLVSDGAAGFVCGSDFRFGAGGDGNAEKLAAFCENRNLPCAVVPQQLLEGVRVSSTYIRSLLEAGDAERATKFLGHPHMLSGKVVPGRGLGRTMGIPTANLQIPETVLLPKSGVYACLAEIAGKTYPAVTNIGTRPTVSGHHVTVETWVLDFAGDLYGQTLTLLFYAFLRPEQKFDSLDALQAEIQKNAAKTRKILGKK